MENTHKFETLLKGNAPKSKYDKWYPQEIPVYQNAFIINDNRVLSKNLAYNMQYIEFLEKEFLELDISSALTKMLIKSYAITAGAIVESLLVNISLTKQWTSKTLDFAPLINLVKKKCDLNKADESVMSTIERLKDLRNRIHLKQRKEVEYFDHDYNAFTDEVLIETRELLYTVLISPEISKDTSVFNFLKEAIDNSKTADTK